ncbi:MAG: serine/threonine protein kinase [Anaerolineales bacterium]|nr:serine/threonine protein kinase [Anaerolineales bacterium]
MSPSLIETPSIECEIENYLKQVGDVFRKFRWQDSGCISYGVKSEGERWFVKYSKQPEGLESLRRAEALHSQVQHPALAKLHHVITSLDGIALVFDWLPGEVLYDYVTHRGQQGRNNPGSPHYRFRSLPEEKILTALDIIFELHILLAEKGFIAVDFYDGCIMYDFEKERTFVVDLDEYQLGPFTMEVDRLPGSRRFMAPEECVKGSEIDQVTNVFTLGRTVVELLGSGSVERLRGSEAMKAVIRRAVDPNRAQRYPSVGAFVEAWNQAKSQN